MLIFSQILAFDLPELLAEIKKTERDLLEADMAIRLQQEKNVARRKKLRRYLARLKTALTQKNIPALSLSSES